MVFDPLLIVYQIATLQCLYYLVFGSLLLLSNILIGSLLSLDLMFSANYLGAESDYGFLVACPQIMAGLVGAYLLALIVEKIKKCLDFSVTVWFLHLIICSLYDGFPNAWGWWVSNGMSFLGMVFLGEYLCAQREMENIPLHTTVNAATGVGIAGAGSLDSLDCSVGADIGSSLSPVGPPSVGGKLGGVSGRGAARKSARRKFNTGGGSSSGSNPNSDCESNGIGASDDDTAAGDGDYDDNGGSSATSPLMGAASSGASSGRHVSTAASSLAKSLMSSKLKPGIGIASSSSTGSGMELLGGVSSKPMPIV